MSEPDSRTDRRGAIRAVLFDFDGIIADTESLHFATFSEILVEEGVTLPPEENALTYMGIQDREAFRIAFEKNGRELDEALCAELVRRKSAIYADSASKVPLLPGAREIIDATLARMPATIASGGRRSDIEAILRPYELLDRFPEFVSADDGHPSKPAPDSFLGGLEILRRRGTPDLTPEECLVFEDSFRGVEAAKSAGMYCVAITNSYPADRLELADEIIGSFHEFRW